MRDDDARLLGRGLLDHVQDLRLGVVVADDLLGEQIEHERTEIERVRNEPEPAIRGPGAGDLLVRQVLTEPLLEKRPHVVARASFDLRIALELEAGHLLDAGDGIARHFRVWAFEATLLSAACGDEESRGHRHGCCRPTQDSVHCTLRPVATDTTRATSWPRTTIPSSMNRRCSSVSS